jgi:hypothetical protein
MLKLACYYLYFINFCNHNKYDFSITMVRDVFEPVLNISYRDPHFLKLSWSFDLI